MYQGSPLFPIFRALTLSLHRHSSVALGLTSVSLVPSLHLLLSSTYLYPPLPPLTSPYTYIQPHLGLSRTLHPLTSGINTLLAVRYSSILSTCPNHLSTLRSALLANSLSIPALLRTSSFLTYTFVTLQPNFSNISSQEHSLSFSQHFSNPMPLFRITP